MSAQRPNLFVFQYTQGSRIEEQLNRAGVRGTVDWDLTFSEEQVQAGDLVVFLRLAAQSQRVSNPERAGLTGFGWISEGTIKSDLDTSDATTIGVTTEAYWPEQFVPTYSYWHDWRLADCDAVRRESGANFEIAPRHLAALIDAIAVRGLETGEEDLLRSFVIGEPELDSLSATLFEMQLGVTRTVGDVFNYARSAIQDPGRDPVVGPLHLALATIFLAQDGTPVRGYSGHVLRAISDTWLSLGLTGPVAELAERLGFAPPAPRPQLLRGAEKFDLASPLVIDGQGGVHPLDPIALAVHLYADLETGAVPELTDMAPKGGPRWEHEFLIRWKAAGATQAELERFVRQTGSDGFILEMTRKQAQAEVAQISGQAERSDQAPDDVKPVETSEVPSPPEPPAKSDADETRTVQPEPAALLGRRETTASPIREYHTGQVADDLNSEGEARAFARLIASTAFKPPMAVGVFGEWGAGKSHFMRLIQQNLEVLAQSSADEHDEQAYVDEVIQLEFNAWHYMETNIWASLVDSIFNGIGEHLRRSGSNGQVDELFEQLLTHRIQQVETLESLVTARERLDAAEAEVQTAQDQKPTPQSVWSQAWQNRVGNGDVPAPIASLRDALGLQDAVETYEAARDLAADLRRAGSKAHYFWQSVGHRLIHSPALVIMVALGVLVPAAFAFLPSDFLNAAVRNIAAGAAAIGSVLGVGLTWLRRVQPGVRAAVATVSELADEAAEIEQSGLAESEEALRQARASFDEAKAAYDRAGREAARYEQGATKRNATERLVEFVAERTGEGGYADHLGLVATIRKDFEQLVELLGTELDPVESADEDAPVIQIDPFEELRERCEAVRQRAEAIDDVRNAEKAADLSDKLQSAHEPVSDIKRPDRIVLYIDDLDRCPPEKVYEVLQAVHLFLNFPLFVAIVAVDTRWVETSLKMQLTELVTTSGASPRDYLEKIIQIPYWVRAMDSDGSQGFVKSKVADAVAAQSRFTHADAAKPEKAVGQSDPVDDEDHDLEDEEELVLNEGAELAGPSSADAGDTTVLDPVEMELLSRLAPFVGGTPRKALRFINVYRIIRSLEHAEGKGMGLADILALQVQLAIATGAQRAAEYYFDPVRNGEIKTLPDLVERMSREFARQSDATLKAEFDRMLKCLALYCRRSAELAAGKTWSPMTEAELIDDLEQVAEMAGLESAMEPLQATAARARRYTFASPVRSRSGRSAPEDPLTDFLSQSRGQRDPEKKPAE